MPFIEQEAKDEIQKIDGKDVRVITPEVEVTLTNTETGQEYMSDKEADDDVRIVKQSKIGYFKRLWQLQKF